LKKAEAKKKKQEKARQAAEAKAKKARKTEMIDIFQEEEPKTKKKDEAPFPQDESAMNAYSLNLANKAEKGEPDVPTNYGTAIEK